MQTNTNDLFFLTREYKRGLLYKALVNVITALSNRISYSVRYHTIEKFLKSIFNLRPPKKQTPIWNVDELLQYLQSIKTERNIDISQRLVALCLFSHLMKYQSTLVLTTAKNHLLFEHIQNVPVCC